MATTRIPAGHWAGPQPVLEQGALAYFASVVDFQPDRLFGQTQELAKVGQCFGCNLRQFLETVPHLHRYDGLVEILALLRQAPDLLQAIATRDPKRVDLFCRSVGASRWYEVVQPSLAPVWGTPSQIVVLRTGHVHARGHLRQLPSESVVLIEPGADGPLGVLDEVQRLTSYDVPNIVLGFVDHASAVDHWSDFCDQPEFLDLWGLLLAGLARQPVLPGMCMPVPACAVLQWRTNLSLESRRACLDVAFRNMSQDRSLMCQENVSGYTLQNDFVDVIARTRFHRSCRWFRCENIVLEL